MSELNGYRPIDFALLPALEARVRDGLRATAWGYAEAGHALAEIRDGRYWVADHGTFEDYCSARWSISRAHAYRLIDAADAADAVLAARNADAVSPMGDIDGTIAPVAEIEAPRSERAARELAHTLHEQGSDAAAETWRRAVSEHGPQPTAAQVRETARGSSVKPNRCQRLLTLADEQRRWTRKLSTFIADELGDDPLPEDVRQQLAVGAVQRAHAAVSVLDALAAGDAPDLDVLDAAPKFADESSR